ncbi:hypothetical protein EI94DRAFT_1705707 [Lactarius quietus]|nr:hypothetical protein EI94DRAFT_1705707 [Lactarius quietus]
MAPTKRKTKTAAAGTFAAHFPSDWSDHSSDESHYSSNDQDDDSESSSDDSDSSTDGLSITSGNVQTVAEGHACHRAKATKAARARTANADSEGATNGDASEEQLEVWLTDEQASMVQTQVADVRAGDIATCIDIIQDCVEQLKRSWIHDVDFNRNVVETMKCRREQKTPIFHNKWTFSDIVINVHHEEFDKMAAEMSGCKAGSPAYLRCYKKALKIIEDRMDNNDKVKYRADTKKWTKHKPPPQQQLRQTTLNEFSESMYLQFGMQVAILGGYCNAKGEPAIILHDSNLKYSGTSFRECNKEWMNDPLIEDFSRWTAKSFRVQPNNEGQDDGRRNKEKMPNIKLLIDSRGYPMLPSWEAMNIKGLTYKKMLIGKFLSEMYWITEDSGKGRVPWSRLHKAHNDFIQAKYLPNSVTLTQYHHIHLEDADSLLKQWTQRQAAREVPLQFRKVEKASLCRMQSLASSNTSDLVVPSAQEQGSCGESQGDGDDMPGQVPDREGQGNVTGDARHAIYHSNHGFGRPSPPSL